MIDDSTRTQALKIYPRHLQENAIDFINYVVGKLPFRIKTIRADNCHKFQAKLNWQVRDLGIEHVYINRIPPRLNGKAGYSHLTDKQGFYHPLDYKDDVDL